MKMKISLIVCYDNDRLIGNNNDLIYKIPEDLQFFKKMTTNNPIIMGRNTWESLPQKPLPHRINCIISKTLDFQPFYSKCHIFRSLEDALNVIQYPGYFKHIFIIGGEQLYKTALDMNIVDTIYATEVNQSQNPDTLVSPRYFPEIKDYKTKKCLVSGESYSIFEYSK